MAASYAYAYLHGFRGDVRTEKGSTLKKRFAEKGIQLDILDIKGGKGHTDTRVSIGLEVLKEYHNQQGKPLRLIGSSMGGMLCALYASMNPGHVDRAILLNPAVNLKDTWITITDPDDPALFEKWKADGMMKCTAGRPLEEVEIPFAYVEDSLQFADYPDIPCPTLVFLGSEDRLVPPKYGYVLQIEQENPDQMRVIELDDDHDFLKPETIDRVFEEAVTFFS